MIADAFAVFGISDRELRLFAGVEVGGNLPIPMFDVGELAILAGEVFGFDNSAALGCDFDDSEEAIRLGFVCRGIALPLFWRIGDFLLISFPVLTEVAFPIAWFFHPFIVDGARSFGMAEDGGGASSFWCVH